MPVSDPTVGVEPLGVVDPSAPMRLPDPVFPLSVSVDPPLRESVEPLALESLEAPGESVEPPLRESLEPPVPESLEPLEPESLEAPELEPPLLESLPPAALESDEPPCVEPEFGLLELRSDVLELPLSAPDSLPFPLLSPRLPLLAPGPAAGASLDCPPLVGALLWLLLPLVPESPVGVLPLAPAGVVCVPPFAPPFVPPFAPPFDEPPVCDEPSLTPLLDEPSLAPPVAGLSVPPTEGLFAPILTFGVRGVFCIGPPL